MFFLLLTYTYVIATKEQQYDCERQPEVINIFEELTNCKNRTFSQHFNEVMMAVTCALPRDTVVPIAPDEPGTQYIPNAVVVKRCGGTCQQQLSCIPTKKRMVQFSVRCRRDGEKGICGTVDVEEHERCKCDCRVMESQCIPMKQKYDRHACMCRCINMDEKEKCERDDGLWDQKACECRCKEEKVCTTGLYWVPSLCRCMRMTYIE
jgi:hypothetical protein